MKKYAVSIGYTAGFNGKPANSLYIIEASTPEEALGGAIKNDAEHGTFGDIVTIRVVDVSTQEGEPYLIYK